MDRLYRCHAHIEAIGEPARNAAVRQAAPTRVETPHNGRKQHGWLSTKRAAEPVPARRGVRERLARLRGLRKRYEIPEPEVVDVLAHHRRQTPK